MLQSIACNSLLKKTSHYLSQSILWRRAPYHGCNPTFCEVIWESYMRWIYSWGVVGTAFPLPAHSKPDSSLPCRYAGNIYTFSTWGPSAINSCFKERLWISHQEPLPDSMYKLKRKFSMQKNNVSVLQLVLQLELYIFLLFHTCIPLPFCFNSHFGKCGKKRKQRDTNSYIWLLKDSTELRTLFPYWEFVLYLPPLQNLLQNMD